MTLIEASDQELHIRMFRGDSLHNPDLERKIHLDFVIPRSGQNADELFSRGGPFAAKYGIERVFGRLIEEWMTDIFGLESPRRVPFRFEWQAAQDVIDEFPHSP